MNYSLIKPPFRSFILSLLILNVVCITSVSASESPSKNSWAGKWDILQNPPENPEVYYYYKISLQEEGFNWSSSNRELPYGPNEVNLSGHASFIDENKARDLENKLLFIRGQSDNGATVTVSNLEQESSGELFYYIPSYYKAGFNCAKASTLVEKTICSDKRLAWADREMNVQYKLARKKMTKGQRTSLVAAQRVWIKQRNQCEKESPNELPCLSLSYAHRLASLHKINNAELGNGEGIDAGYLLGLHKTKAELQANIPFLLVLATEQKEVAIALTNNTVRDIRYSVSESSGKTRLTGHYDFDSVCWPADCVISTTFTLEVDKQGSIEIHKSQESSVISD